jgi:hypothetical protein
MMRSMFRTALPVLLAVLALSAVAASAAQAATEGPFYKIAGARLASGESKEVKLKAKPASGSLILEIDGVQIVCTNQAFASGAKLLGSTGANSASGEVTIELSGCEQSGDGNKKCTVEEPIKTIPPTIDQVTEFMHLKFHGGEECNGPLGTGEKITGSLVTRLTETGVGREPAEATTMGLSFPESRITTVWWEEGGTLKEVKVQKLEGIVSGEVKSAGSSLLELASGANWGVFT